MTRGASPKTTPAGHVPRFPAWARRVSLRRDLANELVSLANLIGRPVNGPSGVRVGRVNDVVVRWESGTIHPPVSGILVRVGQGLAMAPIGQVTLTQTSVQFLSSPIIVAVPARRAGDVVLGRDVLDRQLVDVEGVQVVRAADIYLAKVVQGWELAGVDVGTRALLRRLLPKRRRCPPPNRAADWADLQTFVPRFPDQSPTGGGGPAGAAGTSESGVQLAYPAGALHRLRAKDVEALLAGLDRTPQAQLAAMADPRVVAQALAELAPAKLDALLAELDETDQTRLKALIDEAGR
jgi:sporulation protein YlmC with PRC-barrel domain